ncbi:TetR/AcrR family transcriptional regulator [Romboutsia sedimentorum]|uniref:TetR/AcrR family transcriptional regulator n=1 Tax=Romboutsia sedimentorum TaxID=1368474 RepID=UPI0024DE2C98|nr:TetR/AcrR family transcriptional regulator [Romboutsia sedimentorum]MDK2584366.1 TetR/AcrR family transcriptional regulator [Romboutsia sedimentorum]
MKEWMKYIIEDSNNEQKLTLKQQKILIAAVELISEKGYEKVSTAEIAKRAGVAEGTIFRQYKTKKDLLNAIVRPSYMRFIGDIIAKSFVEEVIAKDYINFDTFLNCIIEDRIEFAKQETPLIKVLIQEITAQEDVREDIKSLFLENVYPSFEKTINLFKEKGEIIDIPSITIFRIIITNLFGYLVPRFVLYPELSWDDEYEKKIVIQCIKKALT